MNIFVSKVNKSLDLLPKAGSTRSSPRPTPSDPSSTSVSRSTTSVWTISDMGSRHSSKTRPDNWPRGKFYNMYWNTTPKTLFCRSSSSSQYGPGMNQKTQYGSLGNVSQTSAGPAPTTKPPTPPQNRFPTGTLNRSKEYRAPPVVAPPQVPTVTPVPTNLYFLLLSRCPPTTPRTTRWAAVLASEGSSTGRCPTPRLGWCSRSPMKGEGPPCRDSPPAR